MADRIFLDGKRCIATVRRFGDLTWCGNAGRLEVICPTCGLLGHACSPGHVDSAERTMAGHVLGQHPETVPPSVIAKIRANPAAVAAFAENERADPGAYTKLLRLIGAPLPSADIPSGGEDGERT